MEFISDSKSYTFENHSATIQLFNIKFYPDISDETLAFHADLHLQLDGVTHIIPSYNRGHGACDDYNFPDIESRKAFDTLDAYLRTIPNDDLIAFMKQFGEINHIIYNDLESEVNHLLAVWCDNNNL